MYLFDVLESEELEEEYEKMICWRWVVEFGILVDNLEKGCVVCGRLLDLIMYKILWGWKMVWIWIIVIYKMLVGSM